VDILATFPGDHHQVVTGDAAMNEIDLFPAYIDDNRDPSVPRNKKGSFTAAQLGGPISIFRVTQITALSAIDLMPLLEMGKIHAFKRWVADPMSFQKSAEYEPLWPDEFRKMSVADLEPLFFWPKEIEALASPVLEQAERKRSGSKHHIYKMLDDAIGCYFENTPDPPSDLLECDREIWSYPAVVRAKKLIGLADHKSLKAGLRSRGLGKRLPKLTGGRGKKSAK
jgi:hypothetical protein